MKKGNTLNTNGILDGGGGGGGGGEKGKGVAKNQCFL